ncbi:MAG: glutamine-hydrolyzing GMP synthase [Candidatus Aquicultor secundus]|uniref:GMP synthase [glutamine-hydrolyzing] n=1 Tax=Candidatus Aquicultor secundus TaxID=1973895 RepID=A0A2M7T8H2_9ACTN|nr:glutamine-hydrolyzing GMP synthase [Candidatus Aquicultor secundus]OIO83403.1 MAG: glutamine-hydrolyzing GMP synthase [Candidatus Aquicultor secundus]PIX51926.1 MAG: glutamine-hydrolyzing GMP synthase [Candidatus Aquicultor secundus]PIY37189.1 MAG: glutamine-hydrolyzing GMP synthase [Candidatus Aquicultor secundus]PIZ38336.1 MAG: glutamine-hydrolyzing GMP synthase [Candidatus Aquicultor secundus]
MKNEFQTVLVVDYGAQYAQLIARRVRECKVYSEIVPHDISIEKLKAKNPSGLIFSGGPASVYADNAPAANPAFFELGVPILGICYGMQLMAHTLGGEVARTGNREYGKTDLVVDTGNGLFKDVPLDQVVWMSHQDAVRSVPEGFKVSAHTDGVPVAAMENPQKGFYGVQFHPEVVHTAYGMEILKNFLYDACGCMPNWTMVSIIEESVTKIREQVGDNKVVCGLSGGVDSSVAAILVHKAIGDNLICIFVDHGLLRKGEAEKVEEAFRRHFRINLIHVKAQNRFLDKLKGVTDPERKRKIIGEEFIRVFEDEAVKFHDAKFLVQGTLYPDVIESGTRDAAKIKTHHNVGGLPEDMELKLVEPLRALFKDEVRAVGEELGLPDEIVWRHPFPGPGLAVRIIGEITPERLDILRDADAIFEEEIKRAGLYREIWQSFAVLPSIRSVGVMGDERTYAYPIILRAVTSEDAMTADWARIPFDILERISNRIINEVRHVNRVAYDISSKPPATIEWE